MRKIGFSMIECFIIDFCPTIYAMIRKDDLQIMTSLWHHYDIILKCDWLSDHNMLFLEFLSQLKIYNFVIYQGTGQDGFLVLIPDRVLQAGEITFRQYFKSSPWFTDHFPEMRVTPGKTLSRCLLLSLLLALCKFKIISMSWHFLKYFILWIFIFYNM